MEIRKTLLEILKKSWWQISLTIIGIIAVLSVLSWLRNTIETASVEIVSDNNIDITPEQIQAIKAIGQWEFLAVNDEVMVDTVRKGIFSDDHLVRIYYGTLRLGIDMHRVGPQWIEAHGDTISVTLPPVGLLDNDFIDETRTSSFIETGKWSHQDRKLMYNRADAMMRRRCLTRQNYQTAQQNAKTQFENLLRSMGFEYVKVDFEK